MRFRTDKRSRKEARRIKRYRPEQVVEKLRQADVELGKARKKRRLGTGRSACHRRKPRYNNHVWGYRLVSERTERGGQLKILSVVDEFTPESLMIEVDRHFTGQDVIRVLEQLCAIRGRPKYLRSDNGPEFAAKAVRRWLRRLGVGTLFIEPGSPWENGYVESFNGKLKDECLNGEVFLNLTEARYIVDRWRLDYDHHRPHSQLSWLTPAEFAARCRGCDRRDDPSLTRPLPWEQTA